jgi:ATP-dependent protease Clp ATPase subunit
VGKLISNPGDYPRAYICDECVAVCQSVIEEDRPESEQTQEHPLLSHPLASTLMTAIEEWMRDEAAGADASIAFGNVRLIAIQMFRK